GEVWPEADIARLLACPGVIAFLAAHDEPVGFVIARAAGGEAEILSIGVVASERRRGIAGQLLAAALAALGPVPVFLEVAEGNAAAHRLYRGAGFVTVGRRRGYYARRGGLPAEDAIIMQRDPGAFADPRTPPA